MTDNVELPPRGTLVCDAETGRTGILMGVDLVEGDGRTRREVFVRPVGGGIEWSAPPGRIRAAAGNA